MTDVLLGTKKGLFVLTGVPGGPFAVATRAFAGEPVEYAMRDPRSGRTFAAVTSPFYGPKIWWTDDVAGEWTQADGVELPAGGDAALEAANPGLRGWVLDERGHLRRHINAYLNGELAAPDDAVAAGDRIDVIPAISGG